MRPRRPPDHETVLAVLVAVFALATVALIVVASIAARG